MLIAVTQNTMFSAGSFRGLKSKDRTPHGPPHTPCWHTPARRSGNEGTTRRATRRHERAPAARMHGRPALDPAPPRHPARGRPAARARGAFSLTRGGAGDAATSPARGTHADSAQRTRTQSRGAGRETRNAAQIANEAGPSTNIHASYDTLLDAPGPPWHRWQQGWRRGADPPRACALRSRAPAGDRSTGPVAHKTLNTVKNTPAPPG